MNIIATAVDINNLVCVLKAEADTVFDMISVHKGVLYYYTFRSNFLESPGPGGPNLRSLDLVLVLHGCPGTPCIATAVPAGAVDNTRYVHCCVLRHPDYIVYKPYS